jgi:uncharacterized protein
MDITPLLPQGKQLITGYGSGGFKLNNVFVAGSLLVFPDRALNWPVTKASELTLESLSDVLEAAGSVELLLLGMGGSIAFIDNAIREAIRAKGISLDVMDTGAACRTYNVLLSEERRVAAAVIAV